MTMVDLVAFFIKSVQQVGGRPRDSCLPSGLKPQLTCYFIILQKKKEWR